MAAKQSKATLVVRIPKGAARFSLHRITFEYSDAQTQLAKDICDGLVVQGYECSVQIDIERQETYDGKNATLPPV
jgi:hypothetical protein